MKKSLSVKNRLQKLSLACGKKGEIRVNSECPQLGEPYLTKSGLIIDILRLTYVFFWEKKKSARICIQCSLHSYLSFILSDKANALDLTRFLMKFFFYCLKQISSFQLHIFMEITFLLATSFQHIEIAGTNEL